MKEAGITLIELMVTIAVLGILLAIGAPSFVETIRGNRITSQTNAFISALALARNTAGNGRNVIVTATSATSGNEFGGGWTVWVDRNGNQTMNSGEELRMTEALGGGVTLDSVENISTFQFASDGSLVPSGTQTTLTFRLCRSSGETGREISIRSTGRISSRQYTCT